VFINERQQKYKDVFGIQRRISINEL